MIRCSLITGHLVRGCHLEEVPVAAGLAVRERRRVVERDAEEFARRMTEHVLEGDTPRTAVTPSG